MAYDVHLYLINGEKLLQFLERALEASGNDLDSAIKSLNDLHLESADTNLASVVSKPENGIETNVHISTEGMYAFKYLAAMQQSFFWSIKMYIVYVCFSYYTPQYSCIFFM